MVCSDLQFVHMMCIGGGQSCPPRHHRRTLQFKTMFKLNLTDVLVQIAMMEEKTHEPFGYECARTHVNIKFEQKREESELSELTSSL
mmetsp:Transcript_21215/g.46032  ORF Transcript_21215/g.46032 Transcript_21215/m.46032 type:complete len:87 (+) Transcript_21215:1340-1600(+)